MDIFAAGVYMIRKYKCQICKQDVFYMTKDIRTRNKYWGLEDAKKVKSKLCDICFQDRLSKKI